MADYWSFYKTDEFKEKVNWEMQAAAIAVMSEDNTITSHTERVAYAESILDGSANVSEFALGVSTNTTIKAHIIDDTDYTSDLAFVVSSMFNAFAGIAT